MKNMLLTIVVFYFLLIFGGCWIGIPIFSAIMGGGISEEFLYPIYWGIMLLGGSYLYSTGFGGDKRIKTAAF